MPACQGSYKKAVRIHPATKAAECPVCGRRFDEGLLAGYLKENVPLHSPDYGSGQEGY